MFIFSATYFGHKTGNRTDVNVHFISNDGQTTSLYAPIWNWNQRSKRAHHTQSKKLIMFWYRLKLPIEQVGYCEMFWKHHLQLYGRGNYELVQ